MIASPELVIAAAAERTTTIRLGSGVTSLPYHHPFLVAQRFVQLDHMTRGRAMLGCGPGALVSDAYMLGIDPTTQRRRMDESLEAIMALLRCDGPVTRHTDWFTMNEARLHLRPYSDPHFPIAVASTLTPSGPSVAGKHGVGILSLGAGAPGGMAAIAAQWRIAEEEAAKHGTTVDRADWRMVMNVHVAETDEAAMQQVRVGERMETAGYFEDALGRPPGRSEDPLTDGVRAGTTLVGSPDTVARGIQALWDASEGGFGAFLFRAHDWARPGGDLAQLRAVRPLGDAALPKARWTSRATATIGPWPTARRSSAPTWRHYAAPSPTPGAPSRTASPPALPALGTRPSRGIDRMDRADQARHPG